MGKKTRRNNQQAIFQNFSPCVERIVSTAKLTSGLPYQRKLDQNEVNRLTVEWDDRLYEPPVLSYRDGKYNVIDGQHRIAALRKRNSGRDLMLRCKVYSGLTYKQEAELCYRLDKARKRLSLSQSTNALSESGADEEIVTIKALMESEGFTWVLGRRKNTDYEVEATRAVISAYRLLGGDAFRRMFHLLGATWAGCPRSVLGPILSGMALFLKTYGDDVKDDAFVKRLGKVSPDSILVAGRSDLSTSRAALRYARVFLEKYNAGTRGGRKLAYRFGA